ncbi:general substrate transporter [Mycena galericulata]|nr:general substrate transporter [Mycena galericulata]
MVPAIIQAMRPSKYTVRYSRRFAASMRCVDCLIFNSLFIATIMVASLNITALFAALGSAYLSDYFGRRISMRIRAFIYLVASFIQMFATNFATLLVGHMIQGLGTGILNTTVPIFQCEIAPANRRGMFISLESFWMNAGYCASSWIGYAFIFEKRSEDSWRGPYGVQAIISLVLFLWTFAAPETPRWLIQNGFKSEGLWTLADYTQGATARGAERRHRALARSVQRMFAQLNGINALLHFLLETLMHAGFNVPRALFFSGVCSVFYLAGTVPAILYVDKLGRRLFLLVSSVALAVSLTVVGSLKLYIERWPDKISVIGGAHGVVVGMSVYFFFFASTPLAPQRRALPPQSARKGHGDHDRLRLALRVPRRLLDAPALRAFVETGNQTLEEIGGISGDEVAPPRVPDEDDLILNLRRRRAKGHSTLSMNSQVTAVTAVTQAGAAQSQLTLHSTTHTHGRSSGTFLHPQNNDAATMSQVTLASRRERRRSPSWKNLRRMYDSVYCS